MKRLMAIVALALAPLGCVANQGDAPIRFVWARALEREAGVGCKGSGDRVISRGSLDLAGGNNYLLALSVETNVVQRPVSVGQVVYSGEGLGDITLTEIIYSYEVIGDVTVDLPADEEDRVPVYSVFRPQTSPDESYIFVRGFGPQAFEALNAPTLNLTSPVTVLSTIKGRGRLSGGQVVETNEITFPIAVSRTSVPPCTGDQVLSGTCGIAGQDVPRLECVDPDA